MKRNFNFLVVFTLALVVTIMGCKEDDPVTPTPIPPDSEYVVLTDDGAGTGTRTLYADSAYLLDGFVFVNEGQTLTIEAGTVIRAKSGQGEEASALIVARGGKIMAEGTASEPIIFTAEADDLEGSVPDDNYGLWGGVILLGAAELNTVPPVQQIEGIPTNEPRGEYGGSNNADNSGTMTYVSIRHGGTDIGEGNEINGLTLGGVGSGTVLDYIEIFANKDDGVEFFGGVPNLKHCIVAFVGDDSFDYDQGYRGKGQFWLGVQGYLKGDRLGEHDGGTEPEDGTPYAIPTIYNATYMGLGADAGKRVITFRDNAGGHYVNSVFDFQAKGIDIEYLTTQSSWNQFEAGNLTVESNCFSGIEENFLVVSAGDGVTEDQINAANAQLDTYFSDSKNTLDKDPGLASDDLDNYFNPIPSNASAVNSDIATAPDSWFTTVGYRGAFDPASTADNNWAAGWSLFSKYMKQ